MTKNLLRITLSLLLIFTLTACNKNTDNLPVETKTQDDVIIEENAPVTVTDTIPEQQEEEPAPIFRTSFMGVGDNIIYGTKEARIHASGSDRQYNYKPYYSGVSHLIEKADISFINQETLMCGEGYDFSYYPRFNSPRQVGIDLIELGFDVINISNNHMLDKGADGLSRTIEFWKEQDVLMIGGYESTEDFDNIRIYEKDGLKIAFLSYCEMTNGLTKPSSSPIVIPYLNEADIVRQTELAKQCADLIMVSVHWGNEGAFKPNDNQKYFAKLFADCGVDVILGHHPHVIQPVEWLYGKDGNKTLCVYSLGNFMAQQDRDYNMVGGIISFDIVHSEDFDPYLENVVYSPTVFHFNGRFLENNVYLFEEYPPELTSKHGVRNYYGNRFDYETLLGYVNNTIPQEFLPDFFHSTENAELIP